MNEIKEKIITLIQNAGFPSSEVVTTFDEKNNTFWFSIPHSEARILLGRDAEALGALNYIAAKITEKAAAENNTPIHVVIDAGDHEKKKIENLRTVAHMMAERARYFKSSIEVDPMPARERRIIHEFLSELPDIKTESVGEGRSRHIVIRFVEDMKI